MLRLVAVAPAGIPTDAGAEKYFTEDNDIAINFNVNGTGQYMKNVYAGQTDITDRFKPLLVPAGVNGTQGFPEFFRFAINKTTANPDLAWEAIKQLVTDKDIVDFYLTNYANDKVTALIETSGMTMMDYEVNKVRHAHQMKTMFITDDYWNWRVPLQNVNKLIIANTVTAEEARVAFYEEVLAWVTNTKAQLGQ